MATKRIPRARRLPREPVRVRLPRPLVARLDALVCGERIACERHGDRRCVACSPRYMTAHGEVVDPFERSR